MTGKKLASSSYSRVCILGCGVSGKDCFSYFRSLLGTRVDELYFAVGEENEASCNYVNSLDLDDNRIQVAFGSEAPLEFAQNKESYFDLCIASPGIPPHASIYKNAQSVSKELVSEVECAWRESSEDSIWIAITGTNGKTTTTSLIAHICRQAGLHAEALGNIGSTCISAVQRGNCDCYVVETSSFQLDGIRYFSPDVYVCLGITSDHVTWHGSFEAYRDAKYKPLANMVLKACGEEACVKEENNSAENDSPHRKLPLAIFDATNEVLRERIKLLRSQEQKTKGTLPYIPVGTAAGVASDMRKRCQSCNAAFLDETEEQSELVICINNQAHRFANMLQIKGAHNVINALCAASAALAIGLSDNQIEEGLLSFAPLEHRIEPCGSCQGIDCYNDSKATNVDATLVALQAFPGKRVALLLGGRDKLTPLDELVKKAYQSVSYVICYGEAKERFLEAFEHFSSEAPDDFFCEGADGMIAACEEAASLLSPGDVMLLSPACASFDEFDSFEHRGEVFKQWVKDSDIRSEVEHFKNGQ